MPRQPREGTFDFTVRDVAEREGWTEAKSKAILRDGIDNGHLGLRDHARVTREGLERIRDENGGRLA